LFTLSQFSNCWSFPHGPMSVLMRQSRTTPDPEELKDQRPLEPFACTFTWHKSRS
jgi:hypothetical protein